VEKKFKLSVLERAYKTDLNLIEEKEIKIREHGRNKEQEMQKGRNAKKREDDLKQKGKKVDEAARQVQKNIEEALERPYKTLDTVRADAAAIAKSDGMIAANKQRIAELEDALKKAEEIRVATEEKKESDNAKWKLLKIRLQNLGKLKEAAQSFFDESHYVLEGLDQGEVDEEIDEEIFIDEKPKDEEVAEVEEEIITS